MEKEKKQRYLFILLSALLAIFGAYFFTILITLLFNQSWTVLTNFFIAAFLAAASFFGFAIITNKTTTKDR